MKLLLQCGPELYYSVDLRIQQMYTEPENIRGYMDIFWSVGLESRAVA